VGPKGYGTDEQAVRLYQGKARSQAISGRFSSFDTAGKRIGNRSYWE